MNHSIMKMPHLVALLVVLLAGTTNTATADGGHVAKVLSIKGDVRIFRSGQLARISTSRRSASRMLSGHRTVAGSRFKSCSSVTWNWAKRAAFALTAMMRQLHQVKTFTPRFSIYPVPCNTRRCRCSHTVPCGSSHCLPACGSMSPMALSN